MLTGRGRVAILAAVGILDSVRQRWQQRVRPLKARRAFRRLLEDPDGTEHAFVVLRSLAGRSYERLMRRVRQDPQGARIVAERRDLIPVLSDREYLLGLPEDTLGYHYGRFVEAEQISAQGLAAASLASGEDGTATSVGEPDVDAEVFGARLRDMHDLWHVVTGYGRDVQGELALLAFTHEQTGDPGAGYIVRNVEKRMRRGGDPLIGDFLRRASARGRRAAFLPAADWEALLERPLEEVRRERRVGEPEAYEPQRTPAGEAAAQAVGA